MDKKQNQPEEKSSLKKLILPAVILVGGVLIVVVLYKFLILGKPNSTTSANGPEQGQDAFQAPAEMSGAIQTECQASAEKIDKLKKCTDEETEFSAKVGNCLSYSYALEKSDNIPSEGQYGDIVFDIAKCYQAETPSNLKAANDLLKKAQDLTEWDVNMGAITCDSKSTIAAYMDLYSPSATFSCMKADDLDKVASSLQNKDLGILSQMVWPNHVPQLGAPDSDAACPESLKNIKDSLNKLFAKSVTVAKNKNEDKSATNGFYIEFDKGSDQLALLKFNLNPSGCLYLDSLLVSSSENAE